MTCRFAAGKKIKLYSFPFSGTEDEQCEIMDQLVKEYGSSDGGYVQCKALASALADLLQDQFEGKIFPSEVINTGGQNSIEEAVEDSIGKPLFVIFRALCEMTDSDPHRGKISKVQFLISAAKF